MPAITATNRAQAATLFHALSDETRLAVLDMLRDGERCVCDLQVALDAAQSRLSFHLKVLRAAGLVRDRKEGRWSYYRLDAEGLARVQTLANNLGSAAASPVRELPVFAPCCP
jgi:ArsR family transcriptional regulator